VPESGCGEHRQSVHALADIGLVSAAIIHEVKNSLQGIANALFLLDKDASLSPTAHEQVVLAKRNLSRASAVAAQTLALVRDEKRVPMSIADILDEVLATYAGKIAYKQITVERRYEFTGTIQGEPGAMRQVFSNIVLNALESASCEVGKLTIHLHHSTSTSQPGRPPGVEIQFGDNGPGIADEDRTRIFEPLFSTKNGKGTGLGLWVAHRIMLKQNGGLRLLGRNEGISSGACFSVFLPLN
jgi:two-component system, NtrC family, sensor kinase